MKNIIIAIIILLFCINSVLAQDAVIHETLQINPNIEMLMSHKYYKDIKVKSIKVKQIEVEKDNYIKSGELIEGEPSQFSVIVEITDMKGNITELFGTRSLSVGDYIFKVKE